MVNLIIISEINGLEDISPKMKEFLKWIVEFERENIDKELYSFKNDIEKKLSELIGDNQPEDK